MAGLLDLLGYKFTGGGPGEFYLRQDKGLAKKMLAFDQIRHPELRRLRPGRRASRPAATFACRCSSSRSAPTPRIGIDAGSLVHDTKELMERIDTIHEKIKDAALAEEYIDGREFYVGILGNQEPLALPPIEMDFSGLPEGAPHFIDHKAKWEKKSKAYKGTKPVVADIPDELRAKLHKISLTASRALARAGLRPRRLARGRNRRHLRHRSELQLRPRQERRVRHGRRRRRARLPGPHRPHRRIGPGSVSLIKVARNQRLGRRLLRRTNLPGVGAPSDDAGHTATRVRSVSSSIVVSVALASFDFAARLWIARVMPRSRLGLNEYS